MPPFCDYIALHESQRSNPMENNGRLLRNSRRSIDDPSHCLSRLVCTSQNLKVPAPVLQFQKRMRERQKLQEVDDLNRKLARAADECAMLEAKVVELQRKRGRTEKDQTATTAIAGRASSSSSGGSSLADNDSPTSPVSFPSYQNTCQKSP